jgi:hypothetical protein
MRRPFVREATDEPSNEHEQAAPWVAAEELQPPQQAICPLDEVDEALIESFPCSDPPSHSHAHARALIPLTATRRGG